MLNKSYLLMKMGLALFQVLCCSIFLEMFLEKKRKRYFINDLLLLAAAVLFLMVSSEVRENDILQCFLTGCIIMALELILYRGSFWLKLFLVITYCGFAAGGQLVVQLVQDLSAAQAFLLKNFFVLQGRFLIYLQSALEFVWFLALLVFQRVWCKPGEKRYIEKPGNYSILGFPAMTLAVILILCRFYAGRENLFFLLLTFAMIVLNLLMAFYMKITAERERELALLILTEERNRQYMHSYREQKRNYEHQRKILHDYKNEVACILGLLAEKNIDEAQVLAQKLNYTLNEGANVIDVNHPVINVLLNQKYRQAAGQGISILFQVNNLEDIWLEEQDIVVLLSNLLDNAIEACSKVKEHRIICFHMLLEEEELVLSVKNPVENTVEVQGEVIPTDKEDRENHGIGMKNVRGVIEKYQGIGNWHSAERTFYYTVIFPKQ